MLLRPDPPGIRHVHFKLTFAEAAIGRCVLALNSFVAVYNVTSV